MGVRGLKTNRRELVLPADECGSWFDQHLIPTGSSAQYNKAYK
jgi:hypothetical protein